MWGFSIVFKIKIIYTNAFSKLFFASKICRNTFILFLSITRSVMCNLIYHRAATSGFRLLLWLIYFTREIEWERLWPSWRGKWRCFRWAVGFTTSLALGKEISLLLFVSLIARQNAMLCIRRWKKNRLHNISEKACQLFWLTRVTQIYKRHATRKLRIGHKTSIPVDFFKRWQ